MVAAPVVEELFLDYKQAATTTFPALSLHADDRKNLAKAISGFGNGDGGLIIWGVDCRQGARGDLPGPPVPIADVAAFKALIENAVGGLTLPPHAGVLSLELPHPAEGRGGFVATLIPAGLDVPYQALHPRLEYYMRAGSSFRPVSHGLLAGMFGRIPQPKLEPVLVFEPPSRLKNGAAQIFIRVESIVVAALPTTHMRC
jgi:hypothetical protein